MFDPDSIELKSLSKDFLYQKFVKDIESCETVEELQALAKYLVKLHLKHQEVTASVMEMKL